MSDTVLEHPLVREYLRELNAACVTLPAAQARELREQIIAHLDEALPPGAAAAEVQAELTRLGPPRSLAADAAGPGWRPVAAAAAQPARPRPLVGVGRARGPHPRARHRGGLLISMNSAAPLNVVGNWLALSRRPGASRSIPPPG